MREAEALSGTEEYGGVSLYTIMEQLDSGEVPLASLSAANFSSFSSGVFSSFAAGGEDDEEGEETAEQREKRLRFRAERKERHRKIRLERQKQMEQKAAEIEAAEKINNRKKAADDKQRITTEMKKDVLSEKDNRNPPPSRPPTVPPPANPQQPSTAVVEEAPMAEKVVAPAPLANTDARSKAESFANDAPPSNGQTTADSFEPSEVRSEFDSTNADNSSVLPAATLSSAADTPAAPASAVTLVMTPPTVLFPPQQHQQHDEGAHGAAVGDERDIRIDHNITDADGGEADKGEDEETDEEWRERRRRRKEKRREQRRRDEEIQLNPVDEHHQPAEYPQATHIHVSEPSFTHDLASHLHVQHRGDEPMNDGGGDSGPYQLLQPDPRVIRLFSVPLLSPLLAAYDAVPVAPDLPLDMCVLHVSSQDPLHTAENILNDDRSTMWRTVPKRADGNSSPPAAAGAAVSPPFPSVMSAYGNNGTDDMLRSPFGDHFGGERRGPDHGQNLDWATDEGGRILGVVPPPARGEHNSMYGRPALPPLQKGADAYGHSRGPTFCDTDGSRRQQLVLRFDGTVTLSSVLLALSTDGGAAVPERIQVFVADLYDVPRDNKPIRSHQRNSGSYGMNNNVSFGNQPVHYSGIGNISNNGSAAMMSLGSNNNSFSTARSTVAGAGLGHMGNSNVMVISCGAGGGGSGSGSGSWGPSGAGAADATHAVAPIDPRQWYPNLDAATFRLVCDAPVALSGSTTVAGSASASLTYHQHNGNAVSGGSAVNPNSDAVTAATVGDIAVDGEDLIISVPTRGCKDTVFLKIVLWEPKANMNGKVVSNDSFYDREGGGERGDSLPFYSTFDGRRASHFGNSSSPSHPPHQRANMCVLSVRAFGSLQHVLPFPDWYGRGAPALPNLSPLAAKAVGARRMVTGEALLPLNGPAAFAASPFAVTNVPLVSGGGKYGSLPTSTRKGPSTPPPTHHHSATIGPYAGPRSLLPPRPWSNPQDAFLKNASSASPIALAATFSSYPTTTTAHHQQHHMAAPSALFGGGMFHFQNKAASNHHLPSLALASSATSLPSSPQRGGVNTTITMTASHHAHAGHIRSVELPDAASASNPSDAAATTAHHLLRSPQQLRQAENVRLLTELYDLKSQAAWGDDVVLAGAIHRRLAMLGPVLSNIAFLQQKKAAAMQRDDWGLAKGLQTEIDRQEGLLRSRVFFEEEVEEKEEEAPLPFPPPPLAEPNAEAYSPSAVVTGKEKDSPPRQSPAAVEETTTITTTTTTTIDEVVEKKEEESPKKMENEKPSEVEKEEETLTRVTETITVTEENAHDERPVGKGGNYNSDGPPSEYPPGYDPSAAATSKTTTTRKFEFKKRSQPSQIPLSPRAAPKRSTATVSGTFSRYTAGTASASDGAVPQFLQQQLAEAGVSLGRASDSNASLIPSDPTHPFYTGKATGSGGNSNKTAAVDSEAGMAYQQQQQHSLEHAHTEKLLRLSGFEDVRLTSRFGGNGRFGDTDDDDDGEQEANKRGKNKSDDLSHLPDPSTSLLGWHAMVHFFGERLVRFGLFSSNLKVRDTVVKSLLVEQQQQTVSPTKTSTAVSAGLRAGGRRKSLSLSHSQRGGDGGGGDDGDENEEGVRAAVTYVPAEGYLKAYEARQERQREKANESNKGKTNTKTSSPVKKSGGMNAVPAASAAEMSPIEAFNCAVAAYLCLARNSTSIAVPTLPSFIPVGLAEASPSITLSALSLLGYLTSAAKSSSVSSPSSPLLFLFLKPLLFALEIDADLRTVMPQTAFRHFTAAAGDDEDGGGESPLSKNRNSKHNNNSPNRGNASSNTTAQFFPSSFLDILVSRVGDTNARIRHSAMALLLDIAELPSFPKRNEEGAADDDHQNDGNENDDDDSYEESGKSRRATTKLMQMKMGRGRNNIGGGSNGGGGLASVLQTYGNAPSVLRLPPALGSNLKRKIRTAGDFATVPLDCAMAAVAKDVPLSRRNNARLLLGKVEAARAILTQWWKKSMIDLLARLTPRSYHNKSSSSLSRKPLTEAISLPACISPSIMSATLLTPTYLTHRDESIRSATLRLLAAFANINGKIALVNSELTSGSGGGGGGVSKRLRFHVRDALTSDFISLLFDEGELKDQTLAQLIWCEDNFSALKVLSVATAVAAANYQKGGGGNSNSNSGTWGGSSGGGAMVGGSHRRALLGGLRGGGGGAGNGAAVSSSTVSLAPGDEFPKASMPRNWDANVLPLMLGGGGGGGSNGPSPVRRRSLNPHLAASGGGGFGSSPSPSSGGGGGGGPKQNSTSAALRAQLLELLQSEQEELLRVIGLSVGEELMGGGDGDEEEEEYYHDDNSHTPSGGRTNHGKKTTMTTASRSPAAARGRSRGSVDEDDEEEDNLRSKQHSPKKTTTTTYRSFTQKTSLSDAFDDNEDEDASSYQNKKKSTAIVGRGSGTSAQQQPQQFEEVKYTGMIGKRNAEMNQKEQTHKTASELNVEMRNYSKKTKKSLNDTLTENPDLAEAFDLSPPQAPAAPSGRTQREVISHTTAMTDAPPPPAKFQLNLKNLPQNNNSNLLSANGEINTLRSGRDISADDSSQLRPILKGNGGGSLSSRTVTFSPHHQRQQNGDGSDDGFPLGGGDAMSELNLTSTLSTYRNPDGSFKRTSRLTAVDMASARPPRRQQPVPPAPGHCQFCNVFSESFLVGAASKKNKSKEGKKKKSGTDEGKGDDDSDDNDPAFEAIFDHFQNECPFLCPCPLCFLPIEIRDIHWHMAEDCDRRSAIAQCPKCFEVVPTAAYDEHVVVNSCERYDPLARKCPLCAEVLPERSDDAWAAHISANCEGNPRRLSPEEVKRRAEAEAERQRIALANQKLYTVHVATGAIFPSSGNLAAKGEEGGSGGSNRTSHPPPPPLISVSTNHVVSSGSTNVNGGGGGGFINNSFAQASFHGDLLYASRNTAESATTSNSNNNNINNSPAKPPARQYHPEVSSEVRHFFEDDDEEDFDSEEDEWSDEEGSYGEEEEDYFSDEEGEDENDADIQHLSAEERARLALPPAGTFNYFSPPPRHSDEGRKERSVGRKLVKDKKSTVNTALSPTFSVSTADGPDRSPPRPAMLSTLPPPRVVTTAAGEADEGSSPLTDTNTSHLASAAAADNNNGKTEGIAPSSVKKRTSVAHTTTLPPKRNTVVTIHDGTAEDRGSSPPAEGTKRVTVPRQVPSLDLDERGGSPAVERSDAATRAPSMEPTAAANFNAVAPPDAAVVAVSGNDDKGTDGAKPPKIPEKPKKKIVIVKKVVVKKKAATSQPTPGTE